MKILILILALIFPVIATAATVSGEIGTTAMTTNTPKKSTTTPVIKSPAIKYLSGKNGGCYTLVKSKRTGKMIKKYVNKSFCKK